MFDLTRYPLLLFAVSYVAMWIAARLGSSILRRKLELSERMRDDFGVLLGAALTLLGLLIGFTFSMAANRYDQRKNFEEAEANAIGTEYVRADLLPEPDAAQVRALLRDYLELRIRFYVTRDDRELEQINARTAEVQARMWSAVAGPAAAKPSPLIALAVAGMNDVLNSQGYTQAALWNRIPKAAWALMALIALGCNLLVGYGSRDGPARLLLILPLLVSIAFTLIADIDTPRRGIIRVSPHNLTSLADSLRPH